MKIRLTAFTLFLFTSLGLASAQKEDNIWVFGYDFNDFPEYPGTDRVLFCFDDSLRIEYRNEWVIELDATNATICDSIGKLKLVSNGCFIEDGTGKYVQSSWGLNPGYLFDKNCVGDTMGYRVHQSAMFLSFYNDATRYFLIHTPVKVIFEPTLDAFIDQVYITTLELAGGSNNYATLEKNKAMISDTLHSDGFHAVRHANGRDWWIVIAKQHSNKYYIIKLASHGFEVKEQSIGPPTWSGAGGEMVFSPDGSKLARFNTRDDLRIFDFDRCTGTLSNPVYIPIADDADNELFAGLAFSADGRYLYAGELKQVLQVDMHAPDIEGSMTVVAEWVDDPDCALGKTMAYMELSPDGRIYCRPLNGQRCMHRINHPERPSDECEFKQYYYKFDFAYKNLPHFPNFRLGPVDGSPCDTLGIDNYPLAGWRYDRTGGLDVDFTSVSWYEPTEWHWVFGDGSAGSTERNPAHTFPAAGPYDVCLTVSNANGSDTKCKTVWVGTVSLPLVPSTGGGGVTLYPNPASGLVTVDGVPDGALVRVYDRLGRMVLESPLQSGRFDAGALPDGVYVVQVWEERARAAHCTLVIEH